MKRKNVIKILIFLCILLFIIFNVIYVKAAKGTEIKPVEYSKAYKGWLELSEE